MAEPAFGEEGPPSRRDRMRAATRDEILQTARALLLRDGPAAITLRAIAREMGMTAPGLYRYFGSLEELIRNVAAEIFTELAAEVDRAMREASSSASPAQSAAGSAADGEKSIEHLTAEMVASCRGFRNWALGHRAEFSLVFGVPLPGIDDGRYDIAEECALRFAGVYFGLFTKLWLWHPFPVPAPSWIDAGLREQLDRYAAAIGTDLPPGALLTFLRCWMLLYGAVAMELFGHLSFALDDPSPLFELTLRDMAALVGLDYRPQG